jgi:AraC-like DNA-binding protein
MQLIRHRETRDGQDWSLTLGFPDARFAPYVNQYWEVKGAFTHTKEHILPMGDLALMVNLGPDHLLEDRDDPGQVETFREAWISGLQHQHLTIASPQGTWLAGVRLTPEGAFRMRLGPAEIAEQVLDLDGVMGPRTGSLIDQLRSAPGPEARFGILEGVVEARIAAGQAWSSEIRWAMRQLDASQGGAPVGWMAAELGWTRQRFHATFVDAVGLAPKLYARVLRFQEAVRTIGTAARPDLAEVAYAAGYYDQAHFNRDFRAFAGLTPGEYLRQRFDGPDLGFARID